MSLVPYKLCYAARPARHRYYFSDDSGISAGGSFGVNFGLALLCDSMETGETQQSVEFFFISLFHIHSKYINTLSMIINRKQKLKQ